MSAQETIQAMVQRLANALHPNQIILFGSYAWGTPTTDSDIDLCLVFNELAGNRRDLSIKAMGIVADLEFPKDILIKTRADLDYYGPALSSLESQIQRKGKVLYDAAAQTV